MKRQIRDRKAYFERVQATDYPKFTTYCNVYNISLVESVKKKEEASPKAKKDEVPVTMAMTQYFASPNGK